MKYIKLAIGVLAILWGVLNLLWPVPPSPLLAVPSIYSRILGMLGLTVIGVDFISPSSIARWRTFPVFVRLIPAALYILLAWASIATEGVNPIIGMNLAVGFSLVELALPRRWSWKRT